MFNALLAAAVVAAPPTDAAPVPMVRSADPMSIVRLLQEEGYKAKLTVDNTGDPMIESANGGSIFIVLFYGCENHRNCSDVQFRASYDTEDKKGPPVELLNGFNRQYRYGRGYLDKENDPEVDMDVVFHEAGMTTASFKEHLYIWLDTMATFEKHIGW